MKKIISMLLILLVTGVLFADDPAPTGPGPAEFTVTTTVNSEAYIGVTSNQYDTPTTTYTPFTNLPITASTLVNEDFAYITSFSNHPAGYTVTMKATAMSNPTNAATINYTIEANGQNYDTSSDTTAVEIYDSNALTAMSGISHSLDLTVNSADFAAATTGAYTGTVTFAYIAH